ncbi:unnamed protein product [Prunus armeniaca]|uniref:Uncharacterized protein n=1 Tax=Prunus armeniaca TaxID=36596 RepID=A0A6J5THX8_PRUAR|nr:unnamed protein product [Prunus armeniaca]
MGRSHNSPLSKVKLSSPQASKDDNLDYLNLPKDAHGSRSPCRKCGSSLLPSGSCQTQLKTLPTREAQL